MYARGMTVREIQGHLLELYGLEVSPDLISTVTDAVLETVGEWQNRPLETRASTTRAPMLSTKLATREASRTAPPRIAFSFRSCVLNDGTIEVAFGLPQ